MSAQVPGPLAPRDPNLSMTALASRTEACGVPEKECLNDTKAEAPAVVAMPSADSRRQLLKPKMARDGYLLHLLLLICSLMPFPPFSLLTWAYRLLGCRAETSSTKYISPSDSIMSPCTAKLTALRSKNQEK